MVSSGYGAAPGHSPASGGNLVHYAAATAEGFAMVSGRLDSFS